MKRTVPGRIYTLSLAVALFAAPAPGKAPAPASATGQSSSALYVASATPSRRALASPTCPACSPTTNRHSG
jgi:hypothetical protein